MATAMTASATRMDSTNKCKVQSSLSHFKPTKSKPKSKSATTTTTTTSTRNSKNSKNLSEIVINPNVSSKHRIDKSKKTKKRSSPKDTAASCHVTTIPPIKQNDRKHPMEETTIPINDHPTNDCSLSSKPCTSENNKMNTKKDDNSNEEWKWGKWVCAICRTARFDDYEEACRHEATCSGVVSISNTVMDGSSKSLEDEDIVGDGGDNKDDSRVRTESDDHKKSNISIPSKTNSSNSTNDSSTALNDACAITMKIDSDPTNDTMSTNIPMESSTQENETKKTHLQTSPMKRKRGVPSQSSVLETSMPCSTGNPSSSAAKSEKEELNADMPLDTTTTTTTDATSPPVSKRCKKSSALPLNTNANNGGEWQPRSQQLLDSNRNEAQNKNKQQKNQQQREPSKSTKVVTNKKSKGKKQSDEAPSKQSKRGKGDASNQASEVVPTLSEMKEKLSQHFQILSVPITQTPNNDTDATNTTNSSTKPTPEIQQRIEETQHLLQKLQVYPMTHAELSSTLIGTIVSKFKSKSLKNPKNLTWINTQMQDMAKGCITKWKSMVKQRTQVVQQQQAGSTNERKGKESDSSCTVKQTESSQLEAKKGSGKEDDTGGARRSKRIKTQSRLTNTLASSNTSSSSSSSSTVNKKSLKRKLNSSSSSTVTKIAPIFQSKTSSKSTKTKNEKQEKSSKKQINPQSSANETSNDNTIHTLDDDNADCNDDDENDPWKFMSEEERKKALSQQKFVEYMAKRRQQQSKKKKKGGDVVVIDEGSELEGSGEESNPDDSDVEYQETKRPKEKVSNDSKQPANNWWEVKKKSSSIRKSSSKTGTNSSQDAKEASSNWKKILGGKKSSIRTSSHGSCRETSTGSQEISTLSQSSCSNLSSLSASSTLLKRSISTKKSRLMGPPAPMFPIPNHLMGSSSVIDPSFSPIIQEVLQMSALDPSDFKHVQFKEFVRTTKYPPGITDYRQMEESQAIEWHQGINSEENDCNGHEQFDVFHEAFASILEPLPSLSSSASQQPGMWSDKYKFKSLPDDVLGANNQACANDLIEFVNSWRQHRSTSISRSRKKSAAKKRKTKGKKKKRYYDYSDDSDFYSDDEDDGLRKVLLLTGDTGSGKTSLVHAVAKTCNCVVLEINTTQKRGGQSLKKVIQECTQSHSSLALLKKGVVEGASLIQYLDEDSEEEGFGEESNDSFASNKQTSSLVLILIDEVDLMFENDGDAGFWQSLATVTKKAKCPIILTSTRAPPQLENSASISYNHFHLEKPTPMECASKMLQIIKTENMTWRNRQGPAATVPVKKRLAEIANLCRCDMRRIMNEMQLFSRSHGKQNANGQKLLSLCSHDDDDIGSVTCSLFDDDKHPRITNVDPPFVTSKDYNVVEISGKNFLAYSSLRHGLTDSSEQRIEVMIGDCTCSSVKVVNDCTILAVCPPCNIPSNVDMHGMLKNGFRDSLACRYAPVVIKVFVSDKLIFRSDGAFCRRGADWRNVPYVSYSFPEIDDHCDRMRSSKGEEEAVKDLDKKIASKEQGKDNNEESSSKYDVKNTHDMTQVDSLTQLSKAAEYASDLALLEDTQSVPHLMGTVEGFGYDMVDDTQSSRLECKIPSYEKIYSNGWNDSSFYFGSSDAYLTQPQSIRDRRLLSNCIEYSRGTATILSNQSSPIQNEDSRDSHDEEDLDYDSHYHEEDFLLKPSNSFISMYRTLIASSKAQVDYCSPNNNTKRFAIWVGS